MAGGSIAVPPDAFTTRMESASVDQDHPVRFPSCRRRRPRHRKSLNRLSAEEVDLLQLVALCSIPRGEREVALSVGPEGAVRLLGARHRLRPDQEFIGRSQMRTIPAESGPLNANVAAVGRDPGGARLLDAPRRRDGERTGPGSRGRWTKRTTRRHGPRRREARGHRPATCRNSRRRRAAAASGLHRNRRLDPPPAIHSRSIATSASSGGARRVLRDAGADEVVQRGRRAGWSEESGLRFAVEDGRDHLAPDLPVKAGAARRHLVDHRAEGEDSECTSPRGPRAAPEPCTPACRRSCPRPVAGSPAPPRRPSTRRAPGPCTRACRASRAEVEQLPRRSRVSITFAPA